VFLAGGADLPAFWAQRQLQLLFKKSAQGLIGSNRARLEDRPGSALLLYNGIGMVWGEIREQVEFICGAGAATAKAYFGVSVSLSCIYRAWKRV